MSAYLGQLTTLEIVNNVLRRLGVDPVSTLSETQLSIMTVDLLNDVMEDLSSYSGWPQLYAETSVSFVSSVGEYKINIPIEHIEEVVVSGQISPLRMVSNVDIRRLQRVRSIGTPRHVVISKVSGASPYIKVAPIPNTNTNAYIAYYAKARTVRATAGDDTYIVPFPGRVVIQGLYALKLLEENGNTQTTEVVVANKLYTEFRNAALNAYVNVYGDSVQFVPYGDMI